jgi:hypothetical protein
VFGFGMSVYAQQYNTVIINGQQPQQQERQWYTVETNNSEKYPIWKTYFSNGTVVTGRGEYLTDKLVNVETNNSDKSLFGKSITTQVMSFRSVRGMLLQVD